MFAALRFAAVVVAVFCAPVWAAETVSLLRGGDLSAWDYHSFDGIAETKYEVRRDDSLGAMALFANSDNGASGYVRKLTLDLSQTPWLHFQWRVDLADGGFDEKTKTGDDYAVRIYFAARDGIRYKSLTLVRSGGGRRGDSWRSPYSGWWNDLRVYVFAGGEAAAGEWRNAAVDVFSLWRRLFGDVPPAIGLVGLMTDSDNAAVQMQTRYGDILLTDSQKSPFGE